MDEFKRELGNDVIKLIMYFISLDYDLEKIKCVISLLLGTLCACEKIDEEDLRDMFRAIYKLKDRILLK